MRRRLFLLLTAAVLYFDPRGYYKKEGKNTVFALDLIREESLCSDRFDLDRTDIQALEQQHSHSREKVQKFPLLKLSF